MNISYAKYDFDVELRDGKPWLFDALRKKWLRLEPEEWVRQNLLRYLQENTGYPPNLMSVEKAIQSGKTMRRTDILIYDGNFRPWMLIECKAPTVKLTQKVMDQAGRYNQRIRAPWLAVCNGGELLIASISFKKGDWHFVDVLPPFET